MKNIKYIALLFLSILCFSCEEVVDVDLNTAPPRLVIDASIDWIKGTDGASQKIKLTTTTGYFQNIIPVVSNATVFVTNSSNTVFTFTETAGTGEYFCSDFQPVIGETYVLTVVHAGETYTATEKMAAVPDITRTEQNNNGGFSGDDIEVKFYYNDNGSEDNFYLNKFETSRLPYPDYDVLDDEFFQGNEMFGIFSHEDFKPGDQLKISLLGISQRYYNYMFILIGITEGAGGGPFQTTPANVRGNIVNQTNSGNYALGYFRVAERVETIYTVQ